MRVAATDGAQPAPLPGAQLTGPSTLKARRMPASTHHVSPRCLSEGAKASAIPLSFRERSSIATSTAPTGAHHCSLLLSRTRGPARTVRNVELGSSFDSGTANSGSELRRSPGGFGEPSIMPAPVRRPFCPGYPVLARRTRRCSALAWLSLVSGRLGIVDPCDPGRGTRGVGQLPGWLL